MVFAALHMGWLKFLAVFLIGQGKSRGSISLSLVLSCYTFTLHSNLLDNAALTQLSEFYGVGILPSSGENEQPQPLADWHTVEGCSLTPHCLDLSG